MYGIIQATLSVRADFPLVVLETRNRSSLILIMFGILRTQHVQPSYITSHTIFRPYSVFRTLSSQKRHLISRSTANDLHSPPRIREIRCLGLEPNGALCLTRANSQIRIKHIRVPVFLFSVQKLSHHVLIVWSHGCFLVINSY